MVGLNHPVHHRQYVGKKSANIMQNIKNIGFRKASFTLVMYFPLAYY